MTILDTVIGWSNPETYQVQDGDHCFFMREIGWQHAKKRCTKMDWKRKLPHEFRFNLGYSNLLHMILDWHATDSRPHHTLWTAYLWTNCRYKTKCSFMIPHCPPLDKRRMGPVLASIAPDNQNLTRLNGVTKPIHGSSILNPSQSSANQHAGNPTGPLGCISYWKRLTFKNLVSWRVVKL